MPHIVVKNNITAGGALAIGQTLHVSSDFAEQMDPMELSSLNELLDRIAALGVARIMIGLGLNLIEGRLTLHWSPIMLRRWRNNAATLPLF